MSGNVKGIWTCLREFADKVDWWVATKMLVMLLLGLGILVWVIRWFR